MKKVQINIKRLKLWTDVLKNKELTETERIKFVLGELEFFTDEKMLKDKSKYKRLCYNLMMNAKQNGNTEEYKYYYYQYQLIKDFHSLD